MLANNVPQIHAGREFPDELPTKNCFSNILILCQRSWLPDLRVFVVIASISCSLKLLSNLSAMPGQKAVFQQPVEKTGFIKHR